MPSKSSKAKEEKLDHVFVKRYRTIKKLGSGNYGTAYLVKDEDPTAEEEFKVLKSINIGFVDLDETVDAVKEADLLRKLDHPFVVKFYDSFLDGNNFCIVTEFCESGDLDQFISRTKKEGRQLDEDKVLRWISQLLLGVHYIHSRRVLHRDLKSRNIFIKQGKLKIGDFGISRVMYETADLASSFIGTPYYMSPEVLKHVGYNSKSDVWSIGCILYELCALKHAFEGQGLMGVMYKIVEQECPRLPQHYSQSVQEMLQKMLTKEASERFSAGQLLQLPILQKYIKLMQESDAAAVSVSMTIGKREATMLNDMFYKSTHKKDLGPDVAIKGNVSTVHAEEKDEEFLSPIERMRRRKREEADKRAKELSEAAKQSGTLHEIAKLRKEKTNLSSEMLPFSRGTPRPTYEQETDRTLRLKFVDPGENKQIAPLPGIDGGQVEQIPISNPDGDARQTLTKQSFINSGGVRWRDQLYLDDDEEEENYKNNFNTLPEIKQGGFQKSQPLKGSAIVNLYNASKGHVKMDSARGFPIVIKRLPSEKNQPQDVYITEETPDPTTENEENEEINSHGSATVTSPREKKTEISAGVAALNRPLSGIKHPVANPKEDLMKVLRETDIGLVRDDASKKPFDTDSRNQTIDNMRKKCRGSMGDKNFDTLYKRAKDLISKGISSSELRTHLRSYNYNNNHLFLLDQLLFLETHVD